jgi:hypothetical protein
VLQPLFNTALIDNIAESISNWRRFLSFDLTKFMVLNKHSTSALECGNINIVNANSTNSLKGFSFEVSLKWYLIPELLCVFIFIPFY